MLNSSNEDRSNIKIIYQSRIAVCLEKKSSSSQLRGTTFEIDQ